MREIDMREIKYKAHNTRTGDVELVDDLYWFEENWVHKNGDNDWNLYQYTGFRDAELTAEYPEGQEIYEGDIVKTNLGSINEVDFFEGSFRMVKRAAVRAYNGQRMVSAGDTWAWLYDCHKAVKVIGSIYLNPELLDEK